MKAVAAFARIKI